MKKLLRTALGGGLVLGGLAAANTWIDAHAPVLRNPLSGSSNLYRWRQGHVYYKVAGEGHPLLLVHGINAAASSYELRKQFEVLSDTFRVYAVDLLGYGLSDRPDTDYSASLYIDLLLDFMREVIGEAVYVIASSLSAAYTIQAATRAPDQFQKLVLICPTGIEKLVEPPGSVQQAFYQFVRSPIAGTAFFNLLASRASLGWYLKRSGYFDPGLVTTPMIDDYYATSHQPGAKWAPAAFISGQLNLHIRDAFRQLSQPLFIIWGQQAAFTPVENIQAFRRLQPNARIRVFDKARLLPHDEHADEFNSLVRNFFLG